MILFKKFGAKHWLGKAPPCSWDFLEPTAVSPNNLLVVVCGSGHPTAVLTTTHQIVDGRLAPEFKCPHCFFQGFIRLEGWKDPRPLFCVIRTDSKGKALPPMYLHAKDAANAKFIYLNGDPERRTRVLFSAQIVGYHVHDEHGEKLSA